MTIALIRWSARESREFTLSAAKIRNTHRGKLDTVEFFRRERDGNANDAAEDAVLAQNAPERATFTQQPNIGTANDPRPLTKSKLSPGGPNLDGTHFRPITLLIRDKKIEDVMFAWINSCLK